MTTVSRDWGRAELNQRERLDSAAPRDDTLHLSGFGPISPGRRTTSRGRHSPS
jgi:hypothetical protein